ncbi:unnamed protein product [Leuciscus chuanchicus]
MFPSRTSNVPILDGGNYYMYTSHFKSDNTAMKKRDVVLQPVSKLVQRGDQNYQGKDQTKTALPFPSHPLTPVIPPMLTGFTMQRSNFKMHSESRRGDLETTQADFKTAAQNIRPTTAVRFPGNKRPETTFPKHEVSSDLRAKETVNTGVGSSLKEEKMDEFRSNCPTLPRLQFAQKVGLILLYNLLSFQRQPIMLQFNNIFLLSMSFVQTQKKMEKQTTYSSGFSQSGAYSTAKFRECQPPKVNQSASNILREIADEKWTTTSSEEFRPHKCGPIHLKRRNWDSYVFQGEKDVGNQERLSTTNQCFFPKIDRNQFPKHVDGSAIRNLSDVKFGRPELAGCFYSTTSQEQFPPKEVDRPKPAIYPPSNMMREQEPERMLSTSHTDFVPLNSRRQELSPSHLQRVKYSHIRPEHSKHDFRTTHNEVFVPKPYCKASLDNPPLQHISHMAF